MPESEHRPSSETLSLKVALRDPVTVFFGILEKRGIHLNAIAPAQVDFSYLTPEQRAESYWALYQEAKELSAREEEKKSMQTEAPPEPSDHLASVLGLLKNLHEDKETQIVFREHYDRHQYETKHLNGNHEQYRALRTAIRTLEKQYDKIASDSFAHRSGGIDESQIILLEVAKRQLTETRVKLAALLEHNPALGAHAMSETLRQYAKEFQRERFIWSSSRREYLEQIETAAVGGKPLLLSGESGTGKTRLVEQAALVLTGQPNAQTPGKDVRFQDLIAKPKIAPDGSTYYEYKEIGEAFTGKESTRNAAPTHEGLLVADDEFNLLEESEQNTRLSRVSSWTPGKKVKMPVTNATETIAPRAIYCAMANLSSERYTRKRIPPEVLRKFGKIDVDYPPQTRDNPELYEMFLAALLDENGRLRASREEVAPHFIFEEVTETVREAGQELRRTMKVRRLDANDQQSGFLWRLANAVNELNKSFSHRETVLKAKGEAQYFKDLVLDVGTVLGWLTEYRTTPGRQGSVEAFVSQKIDDEFLSKAAYTADDRALLKEFLAHFTIAADARGRERLSAPAFAVMTPREVGLLSPRVITKEILSQEPLVRDSYYIDDKGQRIDYTRVAHGGRNPGDIVVRGGKRYEFCGIIKETSAIVMRPAPEQKQPREGDPSARILRIADAVNPYHDALADGGLTDAAMNPERGERIIDLQKTVKESATLYRDNQLTAWETSAATADLSLLTPEKRRAIESLVKDGWDVIAVMPGKAEQLQNLKEALTHLKPLWIKEGQEEMPADTYLWDHYTALIDKKAKELTNNVPLRPYLLLTQPTQQPPEWTTNKTLAEQQTAYTAYRKSNPTHHIMNPAEYAALQARYTRHLHTAANEAGSHLTTLDPLDKATWIRFIDLPLDAGGHVPSADWLSDYRQLRFGGNFAGYRHPWSGFRLAVRVEV